MADKSEIMAYSPGDIKVAMNVLNGLTTTGVLAARSVVTLATILESGKLMEIDEEAEKEDGGV